MGDVTLRFFPEETPVAYENFVTHARDGYYDGVIFHRVIEGFMIQGGDPQGTGMGGESIWGHGFGPEYSDHLRHFRGAVGMAQSALPDSIGSQFYIVHNNQLDPGMREEFQWAYENQDEFLGEDYDGARVYVRDLYSLDMIEAYFRYGGTPFLDLSMSQTGHTIFAQVIDGMDVVDAIAVVETDGNPPEGANRPLEEVIIERVTVTTYPEN
ncbi:MAG: peptidylprolyl isomerase [Defluviitaleaceae bacterium]|nr:peptidylprolyl isomerase [Defluviitaleaceae bacterium]